MKHFPCNNGAVRMLAAAAVFLFFIAPAQSQVPRTPPDKIQELTGPPSWQIVATDTTGVYTRMRGDDGAGVAERVVSAGEFGCALAQLDGVLYVKFYTSPWRIFSTQLVEIRALPEAAFQDLSACVALVREFDGGDPTSS